MSDREDGTTQNIGGALPEEAPTTLPAAACSPAEPRPAAPNARRAAVAPRRSRRSEFSEQRLPQKKTPAGAARNAATATLPRVPGRSYTDISATGHSRHNLPRRMNR